MEAIFAISRVKKQQAGSCHSGAVALLALAITNPFSMFLYH
ncbi:hypothetical protein [Aeromonas allosaccharophila]